MSASYHFFLFPLFPPQDFSQADTSAIGDVFGVEFAGALSWMRRLTQYRGFICDTFQGQTCSSLTCGECKRTLRKFESFISLSLPVDDDCVTLRDCMLRFGQPERLGCFCNHCMKETQCVKQVTIWKLPQLLILHLNRFKFCERTAEFQKNCQFIQTMLRVDLSAFEVMGKTPGVYEVGSVANHVGDTIESGHYTATVRHPVTRKFYYFNDDEVYAEKDSHVITEDAFVLFLVRDVSKTSKKDDDDDDDL